MTFIDLLTWTALAIPVGVVLTAFAAWRKVRRERRIAGKLPPWWTPQRSGDDGMVYRPTPTAAGYGNDEVAP